jgi:hypothetical protein
VLNGYYARQTRQTVAEMRVGMKPTTTTLPRRLDTHDLKT